ncbi:MAG: LPS export ABC transporter periplasmic protein LptC [bacterium]
MRALFLTIRIWIFGCLLVMACQSQNDVTSNSTDLSELPDQEGWQSTLTSTSKGVVTAIIKYEHMEKYSKKRLIKFDQGVEIDFFDAGGLHTSKVHSEKAVLFENSKRIELTGNVVFLSDSGLTLRTGKLRWEEKTGKIFSEEFVTVTTAENDTIYGTGFESEQTLDNWTVKKPWGVTQKKLNLQVLDEPSKKKSNAEN